MCAPACWCITALTRGKFIDQDRKRRSVVPVRFVRACRAGHIGDLDWYTYVHEGPTPCRRPLWIDERGTSGDLAEVSVRCECGQQRSMTQAAIVSSRALGPCDGARPWLGPYTKEQCGEPSRLLIRTASNAYFPQVMSVISLPDRDDTVKAAVDAVWEFLEIVEDIDDIRRERRRARVQAALEGLSDDEVFAEVQARHRAAIEPAKSVKHAELDTLATSRETIGEDTPDGVFFARALAKGHWDRPWMQPIERVVLVHRLREVVALVGFTRFEALAPDIEGEFEMASAVRPWRVRPPGCRLLRTKGRGSFCMSAAPPSRRGWRGQTCRPVGVSLPLDSSAGSKSTWAPIGNFPDCLTSCCTRLRICSLRQCR